MREICEFTFVGKKTLRFIHVIGIESSWYDLKRTLNRQGAECNPAASYYQKTNKTDPGPELFAVVNSSSVFYHERGVWEIYNSTRNISCNVKPWLDSHI